MNTTQELITITEEYNESKRLREEWEHLKHQDSFLKELVDNFEEKDRFVEAELKNLKASLIYNVKLSSFFLLNNIGIFLGSFFQSKV
jgi:hypothetical protein